jgi:hypothetical protein
MGQLGHVQALQFRHLVVAALRTKQTGSNGGLDCSDVQSMLLGRVSFLRSKRQNSRCMLW